MKIFALIPARGGSTRIPRKNVKELGGKALITWSIEAALQSQLVDKVVVSTDDKSIASIASNNGAEVLVRPDNLARGDVGLQPVIYHAVSRYPMYGAVVVLAPTSPIRVNRLVDKCIHRFLSEDCDELVTGFYNTEREYPHKDEPSQDLPKWFVYDGCVRILKKELVLSGKDYGNNIFKMECKKYYNYEIDTIYDFWVVEDLMKRLEMIK